MIDAETVNRHVGSGQFIENGLLVSDLSVYDQNDMAATLRRKSLMDFQEMPQGGKQFRSPASSEGCNRLKISVSQERMKTMHFSGKVER
jgi:hypothetical protein